MQGLICDHIYLVCNVLIDCGSMAPFLEHLHTLRIKSQFQDITLYDGVSHTSYYNEVSMGGEKQAICDQLFKESAPSPTKIVINLTILSFELVKLMRYFNYLYVNSKEINTGINSIEFYLCVYMNDVTHHNEWQLRENECIKKFSPRVIKSALKKITRGDPFASDMINGSITNNYSNIECGDVISENDFDLSNGKSFVNLYHNLVGWFGAKQQMYNDDENVFIDVTLRLNLKKCVIWYR